MVERQSLKLELLLHNLLVIIGSISSPDESSNTFSTQSFKDLSVTSFGTSNGLTLAKIETAQPAVIPAAFQDGKFENVGGTSMSGSLTRKYGTSAIDFTSVSSSGYYRFHDLKVGMASFWKLSIC